MAAGPLAVVRRRRLTASPFVPDGECHASVVATRATGRNAEHTQRKGLFGRPCRLPTQYPRDGDQPSGGVATNFSESMSMNKGIARFAARPPRLRERPHGAEAGA
ncbi:hypothetical protein GCM10012285_59450 [Streptomyces kronopolitis]|uniref:Uncharacterized protein n=1 Tax=Streptomyces kronopolitis TaxID=1612435 RepID=A0ABQ2JY65_9ACTN|nr:hypothetical protein GCM10012285_59450 [Streptomyces kronopolitis]GLW16429.1 hypothetical protein Stsp01_31720 [Streptomyces sp. NBRC 13847]